MQIYLNETTRKPWPRWAVSPKGQRAIFNCPGDLPPGWELEVPLPPDDAGKGIDQSAIIAELMRQVAELKGEKKGKGA